MARSESRPNARSALGRFAYTGLERSIHEKARLGIMTSLITNPEGVSFSDLKELCDLTDGNLNRHLEVLLDEGFIQVNKDQEGKRTRTTCQITPVGRERFLAYLAELQRVVADAAEGATPVQLPGVQLGWSSSI